MNTTGNESRLMETRLTDKETEVFLAGGMMAEGTKNAAAEAIPMENNEDTAASKANKRSSKVLESPSSPERSIPKLSEGLLGGKLKQDNKCLRDENVLLQEENSAFCKSMEERNRRLAKAENELA